MLLSANDVADLHVEVVYDVRQIVKNSAVGSLNDMVLLGRPLDFHFAANQVLNDARSLARHFETNDSLSTLGLEFRSLGRCLRHPAPAVEERPLLLFRGLALGGNLLGLRVIPVSEAFIHQLENCRLIAIQLLRLVVGAVWAADLSALIPIEA